MTIVVLLLIPGELLLTRVRADFRRVERMTQDIQETADSAKKKAEETARSLDDIRDVLLDRQEDELNEQLDVYLDIVRNPAREVLIRALNQATAEEVVTPKGVRSSVWGTDLHYRYVLDDVGIEVRLERDNGTVISSHPWRIGTRPKDFYQELVQAVRDAGADPGTYLNDPTESVKRLSSMLVDVARLRAQEPAGHRNALRHIIQRRDEWYFTESHVIPGDRLSYLIEVDRLGELDWEQHLHDKGWDGAIPAIKFARRLYRIERTTATEPGEAERKK